MYVFLEYLRPRVMADQLKRRRSHCGTTNLNTPSSVWVRLWAPKCVYCFIFPLPFLFFIRE